MDITPRITCEIVDCKYLKIIDTTVYSEAEPSTMFGKAFFIEMDESTVKRFDFSNVQSTQTFLEYIKDGLHKCYMAIAPRYNPSETYSEGDLVVARPEASNPFDPPIEYSTGYSDTGLKFYVANKNTPGLLTTISADWDLVPSEFDSLALFEASPICKVAFIEENVDCRVFNVLRKDCRIFEITRNSSTDYVAQIYSLKSYIQDEIIYSMIPSWNNDTAIFDFNQIAPEDISNIYIVKLADPATKEERDFIVIYDLCKALECQNRLITELLCKDCESCMPSKEEAYKRYSLNRMIGLFSSIMIDIHQSEFMYLGAATISDDRYTAIKNASEKLEMYLKLIYRCGDCEEDFKGCEGC